MLYWYNGLCTQSACTSTKLEITLFVYGYSGRFARGLGSQKLALSRGDLRTDSQKRPMTAAQNKGWLCF